MNALGIAAISVGSAAVIAAGAFTAGHFIEETPAAHHAAAPPANTAPAPSHSQQPSQSQGGQPQGSGQPAQPGTVVLTCTTPTDTTGSSGSDGGQNCTYQNAPTTLYLATDGTLYMTVSWASSNYGGQTATATGEVYGNDCNPSCANGTFNDEGQGTVTLSDPVEVNGQWYYNDMTTTLPSTDVATGQPIMNYGPYTNLAP